MLPVVAVISSPADVTIGSIVTNLQAITGPWEEQITPTGFTPKVVGFNLGINTVIQGAPTALEAAVQRLDDVTITTYVRSDGRSQRTFWNNQMPAQFSWEGNRLFLSDPGSPKDGIPPVLLDVTFDPKKSEWRGRIQNEWYSGAVVLKRPFVPHIGFNIIGDWIEGNPRYGDYACNHIALGADSALVIWSDYINLPGLVHYGEAHPQPAST